jgi:hypothetical protein
VSASATSGNWRNQVMGTAASAHSRDGRAILSDLCRGTHQHWWPADANWCQSLLLDPDATISIDLRKRLFLLVNGRGE